MTIIKVASRADGFHDIEEQGHRSEVWITGYAEVPEALADSVFQTGGYCDITIEDGVLVDFTPLPRPEPEPLMYPEDLKVAQLEADVEYLSMMAGVEIPEQEV